ncbi:Uncharacterized protein FWK35_00025224 [Aphis craccivora]|uniref:Uncharacterized protein n=1 Tax=Aphis craccivora TaxID=307492 RepID=A0A6G0ZE58_APHCR|nr:Uncharacterized protein FWK35_00025224 [Aphis craccivora]
MKSNLEGASKANFTFIYPNAYPYNHKEKLNTKKLEDIILLQLTNSNYTLCESPDEDPLDLCAPVNCHMKYRGFKSFVINDPLISKPDIDCILNETENKKCKNKKITCINQIFDVIMMT